MELSDLTKAEILELISQKYFKITQRDILNVRWVSVLAKAKKICAEACDEMESAHGPENHKKWKAANEKFDSGQRLYREADRIFEQLRNVE